MEIMTAEQAAEAAKGLTFEKVWSALMDTRILIEKTRQSMDESSKKVDNQIAKVDNQIAEMTKNLSGLGISMDESSKKVDNQIAEMTKNLSGLGINMDESSKNVDNQIAEVDKQIAEMTKNFREMGITLGGIGNTMGAFTEAMFSMDLRKKFCDIGYTFTRQGPNYKFFDNNKVIAEADYYLDNGEYAMAVEVKTVLDVEHVNDHLERLKKIRQFMDEHKDGRKLVGAVAGGVVPENVLRYAQRKGLYVLVQSGDATIIAEAPVGFKAKEW